MKTSQLAESCNLSESGLRGIENGTIAIKDEHIESISKALNVFPAAIRSRQIENYADVMQILFEIEGLYAVKPVIEGNKVYVAFQDSKMVESLKAWLEKYQQLQNHEITIQEYVRWEEEFPLSMENYPDLTPPIEVINNLKPDYIKSEILEVRDT